MGTTTTMSNLTPIEHHKSTFGNINLDHSIYDQQCAGFQGSSEYFVVEIKAMMPFKLANDYQQQLTNRIENLQKVRMAIDKTTKDIEEALKVHNQPSGKGGLETDPQGQPECSNPQCPQPALPQTKPQIACKPEPPQPIRQHRLTSGYPRPKPWEQSLRQHPRLPTPRQPHSRPATPCVQTRPRTTQSRPPTTQNRPQTAQSKPLTAQSRPPTAQSRPPTAHRKQPPTTRAVNPNDTVNVDHEERLQYIEDKLNKLTTVLDVPDYTSVNRSAMGKKLWSKPVAHPGAAPGRPPQWAGESQQPTTTSHYQYTASPATSSRPVSPPKPTRKQWQDVTGQPQTCETPQTPQWATGPGLEASTYLPDKTRRASSSFRPDDFPTDETRRSSLPSGFNTYSYSAKQTRKVETPANTTRRQWPGVTRGQTRPTPTAPEWSTRADSQTAACPPEVPACPPQGAACAPAQPTRASTLASFPPQRTRAVCTSRGPRSQPGSRTELPIGISGGTIHRKPDRTRSTTGAYHTSMAMGTIEDIVHNFNTLENAAFDEAKSCGDQNDALNLSLNAMRGK